MRQSGVAGVVLEGSGAERGTSPGRREHRRRNGWCRSCSSPWAWTRRPTGRATGMSSRIRGSRRPGDPRVLAVRRDQEVPWDPSVGLARHEDEQHVATFAQERTRAERPGSGHIRPKRSFRSRTLLGRGHHQQCGGPRFGPEPRTQPGRLQSRIRRVSSQSG